MIVSALWTSILCIQFPLPWERVKVRVYVTTSLPWFSARRSRAMEIKNTFALNPHPGPLPMGEGERQGRRYFDNARPFFDNVKRVMIGNCGIAGLTQFQTLAKKVEAMRGTSTVFCFDYFVR